MHMIKTNRLIYGISLFAIKRIYSSIIRINSVKNDSSRHPHYFVGMYPLFAVEPCFF